MCVGLNAVQIGAGVKPIVNRTRGRCRLETMPLNIVNKGDGFPRIILTEPTGSSAEVGFKFQLIMYSPFANIDMMAQS